MEDMLDGDLAELVDGAGTGVAHGRHIYMRRPCAARAPALQAIEVRLRSVAADKHNQVKPVRPHHLLGRMDHRFECQRRKASYVETVVAQQRGQPFIARRWPGKYDDRKSVG